MRGILDKIMNEHQHERSRMSFAHAVPTQLVFLYFKILSSPIETLFF